MNRIPTVILAAVALASSLVACDSSGDQQWACRYEERSSQTCNHYDYGPWTAQCNTIRTSETSLTPQAACDAILGTAGLHCASTCCLDYEFRNGVLSEGPCT